MKDKLSSASSSFDEAREQIHRQMLSAVSHDLKTPLATIIGSLEIYTRMNEKLTVEKKKILINSALMEAYRLDNFITNILDMAKFEGGTIKAKPEKCDLALLLQESLTRLGPKREKGRITVHAATAGEKNTYAYTDPMLLGRAAGLVLENALKHAGKDPVITVHYGIEKERAFIRVSDNGPGIIKGQEETIFSKYTRLSKSDQQNAGTGLGLAICREIMRVLSGEIHAMNNPQSGATFALTFPVR